MKSHYPTIIVPLLEARERTRRCEQRHPASPHESRVIPCDVHFCLLGWSPARCASPCTRGKSVGPRDASLTTPVISALVRPACARRRHGHHPWGPPARRRVMPPRRSTSRWR